ncbi:MAG: hypothetical protein K8H90_06585, partial [Thermoanaerobaculia bacterium]|nr:hypothetical protein [Thermoanaerobaculia bacterium]
MTGCTPVSIPRWQWRTSASDLSWLRRRLSSPGWLTSPPSDQTHLICLHSAQHAWLETGELELQWRKETGAEGFELWDTILRAAEPFDAASLARLYS